MSPLLDECTDDEPLVPHDATRNVRRRIEEDLAELYDVAMEHPPRVVVVAPKSAATAPDGRLMEHPPRVVVVAPKSAATAPDGRLTASPAAPNAALNAAPTDMQNARPVAARTSASPVCAAPSLQPGLIPTNTPAPVMASFHPQLDFSRLLRMDPQQMADTLRVMQAAQEQAASDPVFNVTPVTAAPVPATPVTMAPVTTTPVTTAPVTMAPVTMAPVTTAPVTRPPSAQAGQGVQTCSICFDGLHERAYEALLPCGHTFHSDCITRWCRTHYLPRTRCCPYKCYRSQTIVVTDDVVAPTPVTMAPSATAPVTTAPPTQILPTQAAPLAAVHGGGAAAAARASDDDASTEAAAEDDVAESGAPTANAAASSQEAAPSLGDVQFALDAAVNPASAAPDVD
jgi:hypothetical protein